MKANVSFEMESAGYSLRGRLKGLKGAGSFDELVPSINAPYVGFYNLRMGGGELTRW